MSESTNQHTKPKDEAQQDGSAPPESASALKPLLWLAIPLVAMLVYGALTAN